MLIGEVAQKTGFSRDTIRYYEKIGLIKVGKKNRRANNYKEYPDSVVDQLLMIKKIKAFGFTLKEVEEFLVLDGADLLSCDSVSELIQAKLEFIDRQISSLLAVKSRLLRVQENCRGNCKQTMDAVSL